MQNVPQKILIFGISGQDGSYLAEQCLNNSSFLVIGIVRRLVNTNLTPLEKFVEEKKLFLHHGDISDSYFVNKIIMEEKPHIIYNLAAQSFVKSSFNMPIYTERVNFQGLKFICEAILKLQKQFNHKCKLFHASTSEMFGVKMTDTILDENSFMQGVSPYGESKLKAHLYCRSLRYQQKLFISTAISFNHQSVRRPAHFVTRKVTQHVAKFQHFEGKIKPLEIGNLDAIRDWGHAKDYVQAFIQIMGLKDPDDFVVSTGQAFTVRKLVEEAFFLVGKRILWEGQGTNEKGRCRQTRQILVQINSIHYRQKEVPYLKGNSAKIFEKTGWKPTTGFKSLIKEMVTYDLEKIRRQFCY